MSYGPIRETWAISLSTEIARGHAALGPETVAYLSAEEEDGAAEVAVLALDVRSVARVLPGFRDAAEVVIGDDGGWLAITDSQGVWMLDTRDGGHSPTLTPIPGTDARMIAISSGGERMLAEAVARGEPRAYLLAAGDKPRELPSWGEGCRGRFDAGGHNVATVCGEIIWVHRIPSNRELPIPVLHVAVGVGDQGLTPVRFRVLDVGFSPDETELQVLYASRHALAMARLPIEVQVASDWPRLLSQIF